MNPEPMSIVSPNSPNRTANLKNQAPSLMVFALSFRRDTAKANPRNMRVRQTNILMTICANTQLFLYDWDGVLHPSIFATSFVEHVR